jgi:hypothetical protein
MTHSSRRLLPISFAIAVSAFAWPGSAATPALPDFGGYWGRNSTDFEPPLSGPGPVTNKGKTFYARFGDDTNPILKPEAAERIRQASKFTVDGVNFPTPSNQCTPWSPPYMWRALMVQVLQQKDQVTITTVGDQQVRRVRLNGTHPKNVTPTWSGDSIGHYEGDTLVIDTVGIKFGLNSMIDNYGTPYSEALHLVERIHLVDAKIANAAAARSEALNGRVEVIAGGATVDPEARKGLRIEFTVEDSKYFTTPWSGAVTFRPALGVVEERVCAENPFDYNSGSEVPVPHADKPDF